MKSRGLGDSIEKITKATGIKNVGRGDKATDSLRHSHLREDYFPRGEFNVTGTYKGVKPYYNFQSQGPTPGTFKGPGYNYESKGPEGVNYFMEEDGDEINPCTVTTLALPVGPNLNPDAPPLGIS